MERFVMHLIPPCSDRRRRQYFLAQHVDDLDRHRGWPGRRGQLVAVLHQVVGSLQDLGYGWIVVGGIAKVTPSVDFGVDGLVEVHGRKRDTTGAD